MADRRLTSFVETALRAGASKAEIEKALDAAGWSREQIKDGLEGYADVPFIVPVPQPKPELTARDAFLYLLMFAMLYVSAYQLGSLLFQFVDIAFPDDLEPMAREYRGDRVRWATAALIVAFPVFLFVASKLARELAALPARRNSTLRKWLTYLTLFVAASIIVGDLIALIFNLLRGELSVRFLLKVLVVGAIAGSIFGYYLWSQRADDEALRR